MASLEEMLQRWLSAGLVDQKTADGIRDFEDTRHQPGPNGIERPGILEALSYLGVAVVAVGAFSLTAQQWQELERWARLAAIGVPAMLAIAAGFGMRASGRAEVARAATVAWLAAVALVATTAAVCFVEFDVAGHRIPLFVGAIALATALPLWVIQPSHPQVLGVFASLFLLAQGIGAWPDPFYEEIAGMAVFAFGAAGLAATELGRFYPRVSAGLFAAVMFVAGPFEAGIAEEVLWAELLVFVAGGVLVALSILRANFIYMAVGVIGIFVGLVAFIFEHFSETLGAPVALMLSGAVLLASVLILTRFQAHLKSRRA